MALSIASDGLGLASIASKINLELQMEKYVNDRTAAAYAGVSVSLFRKLRLVGGGPPVYKVANCVRYSLAEVEAWIKASRVAGTREVSQ